MHSAARLTPRAAIYPGNPAPGAATRGLSSRWGTPPPTMWRPKDVAAGAAGRAHLRVDQT
jgi:hypothetical protein